MPISPIRSRRRDDAAAPATPEPAEVAAHTIILRRGTYCVHVVSASPGVSPDQLPGLAVSAAPGEEHSAVEIARLSGEPWLRRSGDAILVRVHTEQVRLLLTSYNTLRALGATPPKVEVQRLGGSRASDHVAPVQPVQEAAPDVLVHVRHRGDQKGAFGEWVGDGGENAWIEGFTIAPPDGLDDGDLEYQAIFGKGWSSPWVKAGEYCGSRGLQLPILGLRLRLTEEAAERFALDVAVSFADGATFGPVGSDVLCAAEPLQPITAILVTIRPQPEATEPQGAAVGKRAGRSSPATRVGWRAGKR